MPEYLSPGVYVEEIEIGPKPIEGVGTSTAGILGMTERGPVQPKPIESLTKYVRWYGSYTADSYTAYAVEGFFTNGGQRCFIARVTRSGALTSELSSSAIDPLQVKAVGPGVWGDRVALRIEAASSGDANLFKLVVAYWSDTLPSLAETGTTAEEKKRDFRKLLDAADVVETFDNLSTDGTSPDHFRKRINGMSALIEIEKPANNNRPSDTTGVFMLPLTSGSDGAASLTRDDMRGNPNAAPGKRTGLTALSEVDEVAVVYAPDIYSGIFDEGDRESIIDDILTQCETLKDRFAIIDAPMGSAENLNVSTSPFRPSKYGALYHPWVKVMDPLTKREKLLPPGGHIAGIYARSDQERGVHKAPANEVVKGTIGLEFQITKGEQDILNPRHINCIRFFQGRGRLVWGARTMKIDPLWKYVNVRRLFIYLEESIDEGTQWVVFEPNNEKLWGRVRATITQFLTRVWRDGALMGTKPEEAFFVRCDRETMSQDDIDNGRLICIIGVAPVKPAEFVIFRIAQWAGGSSVTE